LPETLERAYDDWVQDGSQNISKPRLHRLSEIFTACCPDLNNFPVYVLLESLHEFRDDYKDALIPCLEDLLKAGVRLYITTRPNIAIGLKKTPEPKPLQIKAHPADIESYTRKKLNKSYDAVRDKVVKTIKAKSNGRYIESFL
jgi:hypothetical protein